MAKSSPAEQAEAELRRVALSYPATSEHFPWGHRTIKVRDKAFVFMGVEEGKFFFTTKLPESRHVALMLPFAEPTGYGLGKSGWVTATFERGAAPPVDMLTGWLDESFRAVAPAKLVKELGSGPPGKVAAARAPAKKAAPAKKPAPAKKAAPARKAAKARPAAKTAAKAKARPAAKTATSRRS